MTAIRKGLLVNLLILSLTMPAACSRNEAGKTVAEPSQVGVTAAAGGADEGPQAPSQPSSSSLVRILPAEPTAGSSLTAVFTGSSGNLDYRWERNGVSIEGQRGERLAVAGLRKGDEIRVTVTASGAQYDAATTIANAPPSVESITFFPQEIWSGKDLSATPAGKDPDGDTVSFDYQWIINGAPASAQEGPVLRGDQFKRGDSVTLKVVPADGEAKGASFTPPPMVVQNAPPRFTSTPPREFSSRNYEYQARAEDPDGDSVSFSLSNAPDGMTISEEGKIRWAIPEGASGTFDLNVVADDGHGGTTGQNYKLTVNTAGK